MIACRTPCALEPDVSEANSFSHGARRLGRLWQLGYLGYRDPLALRPAVADGLPLAEISGWKLGKNDALSVTSVTSIAPVWFESMEECCFMHDLWLFAANINALR